MAIPRCLQRLRSWVSFLNPAYELRSAHPTGSGYITVGKLDDRMVIMVWTPRGKARRIISLRKANDREQARYVHRVD